MGSFVAVLFPRAASAYAFQGGYEPSGQSGVVDAVGLDPAGPSGIVTTSRGESSGRSTASRRLMSTTRGSATGSTPDRRRRLSCSIHDVPARGRCGQIEGVPHYLLVHPESIAADGALRTFASIEEGTRIHSMRGDKQRLVDRAGRVAGQAISRLPADGRAGRRADRLLRGLHACRRRRHAGGWCRAVTGSFSEAPFLGCFTFGEQVASSTATSTAIS